MSEMLNIEAIYRQEPARWMKEEVPRKSVRDMIAESVPDLSPQKLCQAK